MSSLFKLLNPIMKAILRSPLHGILSRQIMIITFTGRRSGKKFSTPVSYRQDGDIVLCATHSTWWRNIGDGAPVTLCIKGKDRRGIAVAIADDQTRKAELLHTLLQAIPSDAAFYGIKLDENSVPIMDDVERAAEEAVVIRIELEN
jgi:hypothetical protein